MFKKAKLSINEGLKFLKDKGLDSLLGGGAEIVDEKIRLEIAGDKCSSEKNGLFSVYLMHKFAG